MPTPKKEALVAEIQEKLEKSQGVVLAEYRGLDVSEMTELRRLTREAGVEIRVLKNTLVNIAAEQAGVEGLGEYLTGPNAFAFSLDDPVAAARVLSEFAKSHAELVIKAGILDDAVLDASAVDSLAKLPTQEVLLGDLLRVMQGPISGLVNVLQGTIRNLVYVMDAVRQSKEQEASA